MSPSFTNPASQLQSYDPTVFWHCELSGHFEVSVHSLISANNRNILIQMATANNYEDYDGDGITVYNTVTVLIAKNR